MSWVVPQQLGWDASFSLGNKTAAKLLALVLSRTSGRSFFSTGLYLIDGGSGKTRAVVDQHDGSHWLDQANTTFQSALPAADASLQGKLALPLNGTNNRYVSTRAAASWRYLHGVSPCFLGMVYGPRSAVNGVFNNLVATSANNAATGLALFSINTATDSGQAFKVGNGSAVIAGSTTAVVTDTPAVATGGRATCTWFAGGSSPAPWYHRNKGAFVASGQSTGNALDADSSTTLKLGCNSTETVFANAVWSEMCFASADILNLYSQYTWKTYGVFA